MKTVTFVELRNNLNQVKRRVLAGETICVTERSRPVFRITPEPSTTVGPKPGSPEAIQLFLKQAAVLRKKLEQRETTVGPDKYKSIHVGYWDDMAKKYGVE